MSKTRGRSPRFVLLFLLLLPPAACGHQTGPGKARMVEITASATLRTGTEACFLDLTVVREGAEPVFADSVQSPCILPLTARSGDLIYADVKWAIPPRSGTLALRITVGGETILDQYSTHPIEALVVICRVP
jgi:hypothetical protein